MELTTLLLILILIISSVSLVIAVSLNLRIKKLEHDQEAIPRQVAELMASKVLKQIKIIEKEIPSQKIPEVKDHPQPSAEKFRIVNSAEEHPIQKNELQHKADEHAVVDKMKPPSTDTPTKKFDKYSIPSIKSGEESNIKDEYRWK